MQGLSSSSNSLGVEMGLNKSRGNMYQFCTHTFNVIKGKCPHACVYCYCKRYYNEAHPQPDLHFDQKELQTNLGTGKFIFVGSSTDMWLGHDVWVLATLKHCRSYPGNRYLFQSKAPARFKEFMDFMPPQCILGTTIETNRDYHFSQAPTPRERMLAMCNLAYPTMVSIEPVMDFDLDIMVSWIQVIGPDFVSIGADSKGHHLPEPSLEKLESLIEALSKCTEVKRKLNLQRI
jgi:DNA repair photolyase